MMKINIKDLKDLMSRVNLAIEKSKINPKAGWIEIEAITNSKLLFKVSNFDYYLESVVDFESSEEVKFHATVLADTFIPLVSKLDDDYVEIEEKFNCILFKTDTSEYTFPVIKEMGKVKAVDSIKFNRSGCHRVTISSEDIVSIAEVNVKGLVDFIYSNDIQQYIYVDEIGAITFTEHIYINSFNDISAEEPFKILLNSTQAKLLKVFKGCEEVSIMFEKASNYESSKKVQLVDNENKITLTMIVQSDKVTDKFPSLRLRKLATNANEAKITVDKKTIEKALNRLMVFDKKFDVTVLNYSKISFEGTQMKLVSVLNKNYETVQYISSENAFNRDFVIRFADFVKQIKTITSKEITIGYGNSPVIKIDSNVQMLIPEIVEMQKV